MNGLKRGISGTGTMKLIHKYEVPTGRIVTYARFLCNYRPQKEEKHRTRITVGVYHINYQENVTTRGAYMTTIKLLLNSVVSTPDAIFMTADINNFYLNTETEIPEYMKIQINLIPQEIMEEYNVLEYVVNGFAYLKINKGMYGLPQAGKPANDKLIK